jgi:hypothetical protein
MSVCSDNKEKRAKIFHGQTGELAFKQVAKVTHLVHYAD